MAREQGSSLGKGEPDGMGRNVLYEVGWTDEARQAAAIARQHGFKAMGGTKSGAVVYKHPKSTGRELHVHPDATWRHVDPSTGTTHATGSTPSLAAHLSSMSGRGLFGKPLVGREAGSLAANAQVVRAEAWKPGWAGKRGKGGAGAAGAGWKHPGFGGERVLGSGSEAGAPVDKGPEDPHKAFPDDGGNDGLEAGEVRAELEPRAPHPHDENVPVRSFVDDLRRKISAKRVMPGGDRDLAKPADGRDGSGKERDQTRDGIDVPVQPVFGKEEANYRYASDPAQSCGECRFFVEPAACKLVMGMVLPVDTCDKFEKDEQIGQGEVRATMHQESLREVGWTDEARMAAAQARARGYKGDKGKQPPALSSASYLRHPATGHSLVVRSDGSWVHDVTGLGHKAGQGSRDLRDHLDRIHAVKEVGWTDEARAASIVARQHGYKGKGGGEFAHKTGGRVSVGRDGSWTHRSAWQSLGTKSGRGAESLRKHLSSALGASPPEREAEEGWTDAARLAARDARRAEREKRRDAQRPRPKQEAALAGPAAPWGMSQGGTGYGEENMRETGWTDEARAAAALARQHGYKHSATRPGSGAKSFVRAGVAGGQHVPDAHEVLIHKDGSWKHWGPGSSGEGNTSGDLKDRLKTFHGEPRREAETPRRGEMLAVCCEAGQMPWFAKHENGEPVGLKRLLQIQRGMEAVGYEHPIGEVSPPGWEGTVKHMKKHVGRGKDGITNPWALAWWMKGQGYQPHKEMAAARPVVAEAFSEDGEAKDARGHGSEKRGGGSNPSSFRGGARARAAKKGLRPGGWDRLKDYPMATGKGGRVAEAAAR